MGRPDDAVDGKGAPIRIPQAAIEKAVEGGWTGGNDRTAEHAATADVFTALDPSFWEGLAKALGRTAHRHTYTRKTKGGGTVVQRTWRGGKIRSGKRLAYRFYDVVFAFGDIAAFWRELLSPEDEHP